MAHKVAVVTGVSSGLGEAMVSSLLDRQYLVYGLSRSGLELEHPNYTDIQGDIQDESAVEEFANLVDDEVGDVELIINNAGICPMGNISDTSSEDFLNTYKTNTLGAFHIFKHFENLIIEDKTHIINVLSVAAQKAFPAMAAYCASKYALQGLIDVCEQEWRKYNIRFTNLYPGAIDTPLWQKLDFDVPSEKILSIDDFMNIFEMVMDSPAHMKFSGVSFMPKSEE